MGAGEDSALAGITIVPYGQPLPNLAVGVVKPPRGSTSCRRQVLRRASPLPMAKLMLLRSTLQSCLPERQVVLVAYARFLMTNAAKIMCAFAQNQLLCQEQSVTP